MCRVSAAGFPPLLLIALLHCIQHKKALYPNKAYFLSLYSDKEPF